MLVANVGDDGVAELVARLGDWPGRIVATALVDAAPQRIGGYARGIADRFRSASRAGRRRSSAGSPASEPEATTLEIAGLDPLAGPGHACACRRRAATTPRTRWAWPAPRPPSGVGAGAIAAGLAGFGGVGRRLERKGEAGGVVVYDDYGHHPTAIRETLAAVRQREPGRRAWAVYEPLTYHRTAALLDAFAEVLAAADAVAIADIWAGRDPDTTISLGRRPGRGRRGAATPRIPVAAPGQRRGDRAPGSPARSGPATPCS